MKSLGLMPLVARMRWGGSLISPLKLPCHLLKTEGGGISSDCEVTAVGPGQDPHGQWGVEGGKGVERLAWVWKDFWMSSSLRAGSWGEEPGSCTSSITQHLPVPLLLNA